MITALLAAACALLPGDVEHTTAASATAAQSVRAFLAAPQQRGADLSDMRALTALTGQTCAAVPLTRADADRLVADMWQAYADSARSTREKELATGAIEVNGMRMPIACTVYGTPAQGQGAAGGRSLWVSMHGGGGTPAAVNDQQWENQKRLYAPAEGIYVAPRAPTNDWNLWHQAHIDALFDRLIQNMVIAEGVNPDRVYIMGYSAGGDGVYQLAPRMADRWAAAAMMAGHPNDAKPDALRNIGFTLHMGAQDAAFERNTVAAQWKVALSRLAEADPAGYRHWVQLHDGKGHWMDRQDAAAVPWMAKFTRDLRPERVVWVQDDVVQPRLYWLAVDSPVAGARIVVERDGQTIRVVEAPHGEAIRIRLDDTMVDLAQDVRVVQGDTELFKGRVPRTAAVIARTLGERGDPRGVFTAEIVVRTRQAATAVPFPSGWHGVWAGQAVVEGTANGPLEFTMELRIAATDEPGTTTWTIVYSGAAGTQERPYLLRARDGDGSQFVIDERNGIVLPARMVGGVLYSDFTVQNAHIFARYELRADSAQGMAIVCEIVSTRADAGETTGGSAAPGVTGWPVASVQRATLRPVHR